MVGTEQLKTEISREVTARRRELLALSRYLHRHPELGFKEYKACAKIRALLEKYGFAVTGGLAGLETAFRAVYGSGNPAVAVIAEYDALPGLGHACGHNVIAASAAGAAIAARKAVDSLGGRIEVLGTPAEENGGGKIILAEAGVLADIDAAMMVHPSNCNLGAPSFLAAQPLEVEYFGREAHAAASPEAGINALDAMILAFTAVNALRQHLPPTARIHGIIRHGGTAANIVPAYSAASFMVRADDDASLETLKERVADCFKSGALASGARLELHWQGSPYASLKSNAALVKLFTANMRSLGREYDLTDRSHRFGSTDMGNLSQLVPSIHPLVAVAPPGVTVHTAEFAAAAAAAAADRGLLDAAKALALTVADLLAKPVNLEQVKADFYRDNA